MDLKYIFFDFGGTIDSNGIHWRKRFYEIYREAGINLDYETFSKAFFDSDDNLNTRHDLKNLGYKETVYLQVKDVFKYLNIKNEKLEKNIADKFINDAVNHIEKNVKPILNNLISKKIKLGIISNFYGNLTSVIKSLNLNEFFDVIADSTVIGHIKPNREIFEWAFKKINADTEKSAMVGDAYHRDISGAHNIGIYHFYLTQNNDKKICCDKMFVINRLGDLLNYV